MIGKSINDNKKMMNDPRIGISTQQVSTQNIFHGVYTNNSQRISITLTPGIHKITKSRNQVHGAVKNTNGTNEKI